MAIPPPEPGLVINYAYLWHRESAAGGEEGRKDRPSVIVLAVEVTQGERQTIVLPITHSRPQTASEGIEIPLAVKRHLGLDEAPSWIVVAEGNVFVWPGYDLRPRSDGTYAFGFLPPRFFNRVRNAFVAFAKAHGARLPRRD
jgi:hypothetical protein